ncbi:MAG: MFS transporter [Candidatus Melainabacteria bacterium]|nr:MFS transporter [Candidatus Melainabacteria bacterium]
MASRGSLIQMVLGTPLPNNRQAVSASTHPHSPRLPLWTREYGTLCLISFLFFASYHLLTPVLPLYLTSHHLDDRTVGLIVAGMMISSLLFRPWAGKWADEQHPRKLLWLGVSLFMAGPLLYPITHLPWVWLLVRLMQGIGFALFYTVSTSHLTHSIPPGRKTEGISYYSNAVKLAMAFSPGLGLLLAKQQMFDWAFSLAVVLAVLAMVAIGLLRATCHHPHEEDALTAATGAEGVEAPKFAGKPTGKPTGRLFYAKALRPGWVMYTNSIVFGALIPFVPLLARHQGLLNADVWFYSVYAVFLMLSRALTGRWADRHGYAVVVVPGMALVTLSLWLLASVAQPILFLAAAALYGLGAGVVQPSLIAWAADLAPKSDRGAAMATFTMCTDLGIASGSYLMAVAGGAWGYPATLWLLSLLPLAGLLTFGLFHGKLNPFSLKQAGMTTPAFDS